MFLHSNDLIWYINDFYKFDLIEPNSKKHRNIEKSPDLAWIDLIRFASIYEENSGVSLYKFNKILFN